MEGYHSKHYGLAGQTVRIKERSTVGSKYPWEGCEVPVLITEEHPAYFLGTVLPHRNPRGLGLSHPYPIAINKFDIFTKTLIVNGGAVN